MIIRIDQSELFTTSPDIRFCGQYKVPLGTWTDMWRRYKTLEYSIHDLVEFFEFKQKKSITKRAMRRWLYRSEIYWKAHPVVKKGAVSVNTEYFGEMEWFVIKEMAGNVLITGKLHKSVV